MADGRRCNHGLSGNCSLLTNVVGSGGQRGEVWLSDEVEEVRMMEAGQARV